MTSILEQAKLTHSVNDALKHLTTIGTNPSIDFITKLSIFDSFFRSGLILCVVKRLRSDPIDPADASDLYQQLILLFYQPPKLFCNVEFTSGSMLSFRRSVASACTVLIQNNPADVFLEMTADHYIAALHANHDSLRTILALLSFLENFPKTLTQPVISQHANDTFRFITPLIASRASFLSNSSTFSHPWPLSEHIRYILRFTSAFLSSLSVTDSSSNTYHAETSSLSSTLTSLLSFPLSHDILRFIGPIFLTFHHSFSIPIPESLRDNQLAWVSFLKSKLEKSIIDVADVRFLMAIVSSKTDGMVKVIAIEALSTPPLLSFLSSSLSSSSSSLSSSPSSASSSSSSSSSSSISRTDIMTMIQSGTLDTFDQVQSRTLQLTAIYLSHSLLSQTDVVVWSWWYLERYQKVRYALVLAAMSGCDEGECMRVLENVGVDVVVKETMEALKFVKCSPKASELIVRIADVVSRLSAEDGYEVWVGEFVTALCTDDDVWRRHLSDFLILPLLKWIQTRNFSSLFWIITERLVLKSESSTCALQSLMTLLKHASSITLISQSDIQTRLPPSLLSTTLTHLDHTLRLESIQLICNPSLKRTPLSPFEVTTFLSFLASNMPISNANFQSRFQTFCSRLFQRASSSKSHDFLNAVVSSCMDGLKPGTSNQRHIVALNLLSSLSDSRGEQSFNGRNGSEGLGVHDDVFLERCICDTYGSVQVMSAAFVSISPTSLERARLCLDGISQTKAVGGALVLRAGIQQGFEKEVQLLFQTEDIQEKKGVVDTVIKYARNQVSELEHGIVKIVSVPVHHTLTFLKLILEESRIPYPSSLELLVSLFFDSCGVVVDVLSHQSLEVTFPEDENVGDSNDVNEMTVAQKSHLVLSCCWKVIGETCEAIQHLIQRVPILDSKSGNDNQIGLTVKQMEGLSELLQMLLSRLRHLGAFHAVFPAYLALCSKMWQVSATSPLPLTYLRQHLDDITDTSKKRLDVTRRSAGLPFLILAILHAEQNVRKETTALEIAMTELFRVSEIPVTKSDIAENNTDLPQVHALNIMKIILNDTQLAQHVQPWVAPGFTLAFESFNSPSWAIRNCANRLFVSVLDRAIGYKRTRDDHDIANTMTPSTLFTQYPDTFTLLYNNVQSASSQLTSNKPIHRGLYQALLVLSRLSPAYARLPNPVNASSGDIKTFLEPLRSVIRKCCDFRIRQMAVRAWFPLLPFTSCDELLPILEETWSCLSGMMQPLHDETATDVGVRVRIRQNALHGALMQLFLFYSTVFGESSGWYKDSEADIGANPLFSPPTDVTPKLHTDVLEAVIQKTVQWAQGTQWIGTDWNGCDMTRSLYVKLLSKMMDIGLIVRENVYRNIEGDAYSSTKQKVVLMLRNDCNAESIQKVLELYGKQHQVVVDYLLDQYKKGNLSDDQVRTAVITCWRLAIDKKLERTAACLIRLVNILDPRADIVLSGITAEMFVGIFQKVWTTVTYDGTALSLRCELTILLGNFVAKSIQDDKYKLTIDDLRKVVKLLQLYSHEDACLPVREATLRALKPMLPLIFDPSRYHSDNTPLFLRLILDVLCNHLLQDDEAELSDATATSLADIATLDLNFLAPLVAVQKIHEWVRNNLRQYHLLVVQILEECVHEEQLPIPAVVPSFHSSSQKEFKSSVLFVREPSNMEKERFFNMQLLDDMKQSLELAGK